MALEAAGVPGIMITEISGHGNQKGIDKKWGRQKFHMELLPKMKLELVVGDADVKKFVDIIRKEAKTGAIGDGKIFISDIANVIRIRSGEEGAAAL